MYTGVSREKVEERLGESIPEAKYIAYVRIWEGMKNLDEIRSGLRQEEIREVKAVEEKLPRITPFPDVEKKYQDFEQLHSSLSKIILSKFNLSDTDTLAGQEMLKSRRTLLQRLLWILANHGTIDGDTLSLDAISFNTYKKGTSGFPTSEGAWIQWLDNLSKLGIHGELRFMLDDKAQRTSPIGWLRDRIPGTNNPVWYLDVTLDAKLGGPDLLKMLQSYASTLDDEFGKKAYSRFSKADMRVFEN
jgi:hypothetical protein